jgi:membrane-associated protease RseP (regulator of RpoE activity)
MPPKLKTALIHGGLFLVTFITTTLAGAEWVYGKSVLAPDFSWNDFLNGLWYSVPFLLILTVHEFGHYFVAMYHRVKTTLPFYIPFYFPWIPFLLGTMGAVIRIKSRIISNKQHFDIGLAGPLAGLLVAVAVLIAGFIALPSPEYVFQFHPEYEQYGLNYADKAYDPALMTQPVFDVQIGKSLLYQLLEYLFADPARVPNPHEMMHYPLLFAGFLALVFTNINLLPIGQLDGGHVLYGLVGYRWHQYVATTIFVIFLFYSGLGWVSPFQPLSDLLWDIPLYVGLLYLALSGLKKGPKDTLMYALLLFAVQYGIAYLSPGVQGYSGWFLFLVLIGRFGVLHPRAEIEEPLSRGRQWLGWITLLLFLLTFSPRPIDIQIIGPTESTPSQTAALGPLENE